MQHFFFPFPYRIRKFNETGYKDDDKNNAILTSLASGSLSFTVVNVDQTSLGIFNIKVSEHPVRHYIKTWRA